MAVDRGFDLPALAFAAALAAHDAVGSLLHPRLHHCGHRVGAHQHRRAQDARLRIRSARCSLPVRALARLLLFSVFPEFWLHFHVRAWIRGAVATNSRVYLRTDALFELPADNTGVDVHDGRSAPLFLTLVNQVAQQVIAHTLEI